MRSPNTANINQWLKEAVTSQRNGDLQKAELFYAKVLRYDPQNADALHLLGLIDFQRGEAENACLKIQSAVIADPTFGGFYRSLGIVKESLGKDQDAMAAYREAIARDSDDITSISKLGQLYHRLGQLEEAESCFLKCLRVQSSDAVTFIHLGLVHRAKKQFNQAIYCFKKALELDPVSLPARSNLAISLKDIGQFLPAIREIKLIIEERPADPTAYYHLGLIYDGMGKAKSAISAYEKAIALKADFAQPHNNLGILLQAIGHTREAIRCFQKAIQFEPLNAEAHYNLGALYKYHEQYSDAIRCLRKSLAINPHFRLANIELKSYYRDICSWIPENEWSSDPNDFLALRASVGMFPELSDVYLENVLADARKRSHEIETRIKLFSTSLSFPRHYENEKKIVVGYLSNNFRDHPTAHLVCDMFRRHNRDKFEIKCFSYGKNDQSIYRKKIEKECDQFIDLYNQSSLDAAQRINQEKTQILVDLNGYNACSRTDICGFRPAPVQVRYLGAAKTTGASFFDYIIGDRIVTPRNQADYYSEKLVWMPHSYQVNSRTYDCIAKDKQERKHFEIPVNSFVFCSFSTSYKIDPELFKCWIRILEKVPDSVLWLLKRDDAVEQKLRSYAELLGIRSNRLIFAKPCSLNTHLSRLSLADLCLDTRVVNGAATTSDALWAGVPVVTIKGAHFCSRMSASILTAVGLSELVTDDLPKYENLAITLATDIKKLNNIVETLKTNKSSYPLFDTQRFVNNLETAFEKMWETYESGKAPRHIHIKECDANENEQVL